MHDTPRSYTCNGVSACLASAPRAGTHHLGRLGAADGKFEVGVLLPVPEEERELGEEAVVGIADQLDGRGTRVARNAALELGRAGDEGLPALELVFVLNLVAVSACPRRQVRGMLTTASRSFLISAAASSPV
jgi:hypothetical protein